MEIGLMLIETRKVNENNPEEFKKVVDEFTKKRKSMVELEWLKSLTDDELKFLQTETKEERDKRYDSWAKSHR